MKKIVFAAMSAAVCFMFASCSGKESTSASQTAAEDTVIETEPSGAVCEVVTADSERDTVFSCGGTDYDMRLLDRIYRIDEDKFLSVSMMIPADKSPLTTSLMAVVDSNFVYFTDTRLDARDVVDTPAAMAGGIAACGDAFKKIDFSISGNGGYNITVGARPVYASDRYMTYQIFAYAYTGGAHGETNYYYVTYDTKSGMELGESALLPPADMVKIRERLVSVMAADENISVEQLLAKINEYVTAFSDNARPYTVADFPVYNVARIAQGYVFSYPEYTIAPHSDGNIIVVVPFEPGAKAK